MKSSVSNVLPKWKKDRGPNPSLRGEQRVSEGREALHKERKRKLVFYPLLDLLTWNYLNTTSPGESRSEKEGSNESEENSTLWPWSAKDHCHLTNWIWTKSWFSNQATCPLVDREWVCRPPHYSPPKINSISSEYILSFHLSSPMHSQYYSPNHGY